MKTPLLSFLRTTLLAVSLGSAAESFSQTPLLEDISKGFAPPGHAKPALGSSAESPMEKRIVFGPESASQWSAAESSVEASAPPVGAGPPVLHWHIAVDHFGGEAKYPIGWPRISRTLRDAATRDWSGWDYLQLRIYTDTSREALPRETAGFALHTPDKEGAYHHPLQELKKGAWTQVRLPLSQVPRHHDVRLMQFHISESNYRHGDKLDVYLEEIALLRHAQPTLLDFAPEQAVMFTDANEVAVNFQATGIKHGASAPVTCELRQGGKTAARATVDATRGLQRVTLDLRGVRLAAGNCELLGSIAGGASTKGSLRLVTSPWQGKEP